jgi:hypothetical protein
MKSTLLRRVGLGVLLVALAVGGCGLLEPDDQYSLLRQRFSADVVLKIESGGIRLEGGDGLSVPSAVKVVGAATEQESMAAERFFFSKMFGREGIEWTPTGQTAVKHAGRSYDVVRIALAGEKARRDYYFDVTESRRDEKAAPGPPN